MNQDPKHSVEMTNPWPAGQKRLTLVERLRQYRVSADPAHPVHPLICDEAADYIELLHRRLDLQPEETVDERESA